MLWMILYHFIFWYDGGFFRYSDYIFIGALNIFIEEIYLCYGWFIFIQDIYFLEVNKRKF